ncbi:MAG: peptidoglycan DD-metalloendopeptidase family protein [bacterium]|nr:peptidoglycan DD-metalloendopeptidase family protein [bacterium]
MNATLDRPLHSGSQNSPMLPIFVLLFLALLARPILAENIYGSNQTNLYIPDNDGWVASTIVISGAPAGATVTAIDVHFSAIHPYAGDLNIDINDQGLVGNYDLWANEGGAMDNPSRTVYGVNAFNGLPVNGTWHLWGRDTEAGDGGYVDEWWIRIYYDVSVPDLVPQNLTVTPLTVNVGDPATVSFRVYNQGTATAAASTTNIRLSSSSTNVTTSDPLLKTVTTPSIGPGGFYDHTESVTIPSVSPGTWYVWVILDVYSTVGQSNENNDKANTSITINQNVPDLIPQNLTVSPTTVNAGASATVNFRVNNQGTATAAASTTNIRLSSSSTNVTTSDPLLKTVTTPSIGPGDFYDHNESVTIPSVSPGTWYVWVILDVDSAVGQTNEDNDYANTSITVGAAGQADLLIQSLTATPNSAYIGETVTVNFTVYNQGDSAAGSSTTNIRLNTSSTSVESSDILLKTVTTPALAANSSVAHNESVKIPLTGPGQYFVWVILDVDNAIGQSDESNDKANTLMTLDLRTATSFRMPIGGTLGADLRRLSCSRFSQTQYPKIRFNDDGDASPDANEWYVATAFKENRYLSGGFNSDQVGDYDDFNADELPDYHPGEDWNLTTGGDSDENEEIYAIADGVVTFRGCAYGQTVVLVHKTEAGELISSFYGHMASPSPFQEGDSVNKGQVVGYVGTTSGGSCSGVVGAHLHFEIRKPSMLDPQTLQLEYSASMWPATGTADNGLSFIEQNYYNPSEFLGLLFADGFESGDVSGWSTNVSGRTD